jgi:carboxylesterase type B
MKLVLILSYLAGLVLSSVTKKTTSWGPWGSWGPWAAAPIAIDTVSNVVYQGLYESEVEAFLGIQYGQDTSGQNRFKSPQPYSYTAGSTVLAQAEGDACPQPLGAIAYPLYLSNITSISENCLLLNVKRPNGTTNKSKLPVMVFIHGGISL